MDADVIAILLAAGGGTRFTGRGHKLTADLGANSTRPAESVAQRALAHVTSAGFARVIVVTGRLDADELGIDLNARSPVSVVHNASWHHGQATSVATGLAAANDADARIAVIGLADQPGIGADAWRRVAGSPGARAPIAVATYGGRRANPVGLHRDAWPLLPTSGDEGARSVMRIHPELVVEVPCPGSPDDIDTVEDLRRWQSS